MLFVASCRTEFTLKYYYQKQSVPNFGHRIDDGSVKEICGQKIDNYFKFTCCKSRRNSVIFNGVDSDDLYAIRSMTPWLCLFYFEYVFLLTGTISLYISTEFAEFKRKSH